MADVASPTVSIVVPVYNRPALIAQCLQSLFAQNYPQPLYDIYVVDDGSTDATPEVIHQIRKTWSGNTHLIQQANLGPASARNAGVAASKAEVIAFIDSDCEASSDWLSSLVDVLKAPDVVGVGGPIRGAAPQSWVERYLVDAEFFRHRVRHQNVDYLITISAAYRRAAFTKIGGFTARKGVWNEDVDLSLRLRQAGYRLAVTPHGDVIHHGTPDSVPRLAHELYRYGYGSAILAPGWGSERSTAGEFIRHMGAAILAPYLALRLRQQSGWLPALTFWPLIVVEHLAFCSGLLRGVIARGDGI